MDKVSQDTIEAFFPLKTDVPNEGWNAYWRRLFTTHLIAMGESPLYTSETTSSDLYRFFSVENPSSVVTVQIDDGIAFAVCKRIDTVTDNGRALTFAEQRIELTDRDRNALLSNVERSAFWSLSIDGEPHGLDGFRYVVEARVNDRYNVVDRWCPTKDAFADLCQSFLGIHSRVWSTGPNSRWWSRLFQTESSN